MSSASSATPGAAAYRFGRFALQPAERRLLADGTAMTVGARAFDLLLVLVERAGRLVPKNDLLNLVWPGLVVEENNLQVQISTLRKLLGPGSLATIPGRGYRFELPVEEEGAAPARSSDAADAAKASPLATADSGPPPPQATAHAVLPPQGVPTNLSARQSTLYGRSADLAAIKTLLAKHVVVTIAGAGGIGKTRVAQTIAAQLAVESTADFPDGVWWVELAPLSDGALVAAAVARVLGTVVGSDRPAADIVASVLAPQRLLLVLDNCEHLTDAAAEFVDTVCAAAPGLRVLVTSQETLKSADEHVYRLGALAVPARDAALDAPHAGAVEMFAARAEAVDPRFTLTPDNLRTVADICRRLDGIPLAIELAAARIPLLGVEGVRARLDDRFSVLTAGSRVVLRRHQTLRATLEWSHGLLTPDEQSVFRRLGVFAGSFTLEAAQHVVRDTQIDEWAALDHLGALVDKSLVLAEGDPVPRYRLLETTRVYALERLGDAGETASSMRLHAEALLRCLQAKQLLRAVAAAEIDNLRAALAWTATAQGCNELAVSLAAHSLRVWNATAQLHEGLEHALALKGRLSDDLPPTLVARFWLTVAELGQYTTRRESYDAAGRAVELCRALDDPPLLFAALIQQAVQGIRFGTIEDMGRAIAEAEGLIRPDWPAERHSRLEFARARHFGRQGRIEESLAAAERQAAINAREGSEVGMHYAMSNVVAALNRLGRYQEALTRARASIARLDVIGGSAGAGHLWLGVLHAELLLGHVAAALEAGRTGYALLLREGDELRVFSGLALCASAQGRLADAARIAGYADAVLARAGALQDIYGSALRERLAAALDPGLSAEDQARLRAEGAAMREEDAVRLALGHAS